jgi:predicted RecA/RadA family phage recombinase
MNNAELCGEEISMTAPYAVTSGAGALVGKIFGVAAKTLASGAVGTFSLQGVFRLAKEATTATFADGDPVYWDNTNKVCTNVAQSNWMIGQACLINQDGTSALGGGATDATVRVRLLGAAARAFFKSSEQTGTGSAQNVAHGLGQVPLVSIIVPTDTSPATTGSMVVTEGTNTSTNVVVTVTSGKKFKVLAWG